jgi:hypothetical protein
MNYNKHILHFCLLVFVILLFISLFVYINKIQSPYLNNINIVSDLTKSPQKDSSKNKTIIGGKTQNNTALTIYQPNQNNLLTNFNVDTNNIVLSSFLVKLKKLLSTKKGKIRIAYLGDSIIEGDLVSQTLRKLLQEKFGGYGVGFVPITSVVSNFRISVNHSYSTNWRESSFRNKTATTPLFLSGKVFFANGYNWVDILDKTAQQPTKKYLYTGYKPNTGQVVVNKTYQSINATSSFNKILIDSGFSNKIRLESSDAFFPLYGVSFESDNGVFVDNLSFRGSGGFDFNNIDLSFLQSINTQEPYDLIILQYGANVITSSNQSNFDWYYKSMMSSIDKLKKGFPSSEILLMSAADRAFKYPDGIYTAKGLPSLIETQRKIAFDSNINFYNTFESMGGLNTMVNWATQNPPLAAKDYTHVSFKGADILGNTFFKVLMENFNKLP